MNEKHPRISMNAKLIFLLALWAGCATAQTGKALPALQIDPADTTVSGASSGGYMAVQLHVAFSARFGKGAAAISGGPFNCAEGSVLRGLTRCLGKTDIPVDELVQITRKWAVERAIDPVENLAKSKVYIFSGAKDSTVPVVTSEALAKYYAAFLPAGNVVLKKDIPAEHAFVTDSFGAACDTKGAPFINNCGFDLAGAILAHLYGPLVPRAATAGGALLEFDQAAFEPAHGMGSTGYAYVPKSCTAGETCRVHVALHGCRQNATEVGDAFAKNSGYNRWADTNRLVVLYPQTGKGATNGCWDWWGYDDANYAKKSAPQMKAIVAMIDRLASGAAKK
jgi:Esterase PHB depolymerase